MKKLLILTVLSLFYTTGCRKTVTVDAELTGTKWTLSTIQDVKSNEILNFPADAAGKISIVFTGSQSVLTFSGICNSGTGTYSASASEQSLNVINLGSTKIYCKYAEWEGYTLQSLNKAFKYKITGSTLTVYSNGDYNLNFTSK